MKVKSLVIVICIILLSGGIQAQEIKLKKSFFSGWKYSLNGGHSYRNVGVSAHGLLAVMKGDELAIRYINGYKNHIRVAKSFGFVGGFLIGWPIGGSIAGKEWNDTYSAMIYTGIPLTIISMVFEAKASSHLKRGINIYNRNQKSVLFEPKFQLSKINKKSSFGLSLVYNF
jgi:hypothetical protein